MRKKIRHTVLAFLPAVLFAVLFVVSCVRKHPETIDIDIRFGAEKLTEDGKDMYADNDSSWIFKDAAFRTKTTSHSGKYSYMTSPRKRFAMAVQIPDAGPDDYVVMSVWRKNGNLKTHLVAASPEKDVFYKSVNQGIAGLDGWEELKLEFFLPPNYPGTGLKIYVWNNSNDTVFFDDLSVIIKPGKKRPVYYKEQAIYIELDTSAYLKILEVRNRAFEVGILQSQDDDWVKGFIFGDGKMMKTKLRLKGDWLDHLYGDKWSFRLKLRKENTWKRLKVFSIQNPVARHGVDEWYFHKVLLHENILTTRYGFVPVYLNNKNLGLYGWEEHFTKQLIESQDKREGPIIRFFENVYWDKIRAKKAGLENVELPFFQAAIIKPFRQSKIIEDTAMFNQFRIAQNLLLQYKQRTKPASEIFNVDALARFYALCDVYQAYHSLVWHNQRFYYNPVLCKLEPIGFDSYTETGFFDWINRTIYGDISYDAVHTLGDEYLMMRELFNDFRFLNKYVEYLEEYSSAAFIDSMVQRYEQEAMYDDSLIRMEFPDLKFSTERLSENAINIRNELSDFKRKVNDRERKNLKWKNESKTGREYTKGLAGYYAGNLVVAYKQQKQGDSVLIRVVNYFPDPVLLLGTGKNNRKIRQFLHPEPRMEGYDGTAGDSYEFRVADNYANYLFFLAGMNDETVTAEILPWPEPDGQETPLQELLSKINLAVNPAIDHITDKNIYLKKGQITINSPFIIPEGYTVHFNAGTTIDLTDSAMFISYSPVIMQGSKEKPVVITSSDFTGNGFTVLQADKWSKLENVVFQNLNTLDYKGWTLTGAVTFYESNVDMTNVRFYRNQCEDALNTIRSDFSVDNCSFEYTYSDAFDSDFCTGKLTNTTFTNIGNDAIDFSGSKINIGYCSMKDVNDKGVSGGEDSHLTVDHVEIVRANIGIASKDLSGVRVDNSQIKDCNYGLVLLQKKPEYGPATMTLNKTQITNPKTRMLIETGSSVTFNGKVIKGTKEKLADIFYK